MNGMIIMHVSLNQNVSLPQFSEGKDSTILQNKKIYSILFYILIATQSPLPRWNGQRECPLCRHNHQKAQCRRF